MPPAVTVIESLVCPPGLQDKVAPEDVDAERTTEVTPQVSTWLGLTVNVGGTVSIVTTIESVTEQPLAVDVAVTV